MRPPIIGVLVATLVGCASLNGVIPDPTGDAATKDVVTEDVIQEPGEVSVNAATTQTPPPLPDLGPAPELANEIWLNSETPLRLADLRGEVVLLDMWTFG